MTYRELIELIKENADLDTEACIYMEAYEDFHSSFRIESGGPDSVVGINGDYIIVEGY